MELVQPGREQAQLNCQSCTALGCPSSVHRGQGHRPSLGAQLGAPPAPGSRWGPFALPCALVFSHRAQLHKGSSPTLPFVTTRAWKTDLRPFGVFVTGRKGTFQILPDKIMLMANTFMRG